MWTNKRWWIVGASEGLGQAVARAVAAKGAHVILSARSEGKLADLAAELPNAEALALDVTDPASIAAAIAAAGEVDGIIFSAGAYDPMPVQRWDDRSVTQMFEVNLVGAARFFGGVLPGWAERDRGHLAVVGSLSGYRGLPGSIGYSSSKAGLMHLTECIAADLKGTGVQVSLLIPGFIRTRLTDKNDFKMPMIMAPEEAAGHVVRGIEAKRMRTAFPWRFAALFRLGNVMPDWLYYRIFA